MASQEKNAKSIKTISDSVYDFSKLWGAHQKKQSAPYFFPSFLPFIGCTFFLLSYIKKEKRRKNIGNRLKRCAPKQSQLLSMFERCTLF